MPKTYNVRLNSIDRISGDNNNATYAVNLSNILPADVEYWNVRMYFTCNTSYYLDLIDDADGSIELDKAKAFVLLNTVKTLGVNTKTNGPNNYLGYIRRVTDTQNITDAIANPVAGTRLAYYYADNCMNPPVTIKAPTDSFLQLSIYQSHEIGGANPDLFLRDSDPAGIQVADMTNYFMILSFEACYDN